MSYETLLAQLLAWCVPSINLPCAACRCNYFGDLFEMTQRHKHADVLIAIAEGKEVEWETRDGKWIEMTPGMNPLTHPEYPWQIKPKPEAEWKQKLRQAAREGKRIERYNQIAQRHLPCQITDFPDQYGFLPDEKESDYRIVPKTVTRWLWTHTWGDSWNLDSRYHTVEEADKYFTPRFDKHIRLDHTAQEFNDE